MKIQIITNKPIRKLRNGQVIREGDLMTARDNPHSKKEIYGLVEVKDWYIGKVVNNDDIEEVMWYYRYI